MSTNTQINLDAECFQELFVFFTVMRDEDVSVIVSDTAERLLKYLARVKLARLPTCVRIETRVVDEVA